MRPPLRSVAAALLAPLAASAALAVTPLSSAELAARRAHQELLAGRLDSATQTLAAAEPRPGAPPLMASDAARLSLSAAELTYYRAFLAGSPYDPAIAELREALALAQRAGGFGMIAEAQDLLALALYARDFDASAHPEARALLEAALATRRALPDPRGVAESLFHLGLTYEHRDHPTAADLVRARELYGESLAEATAHHHPYEASYAERHLAGLAEERGDLAAARAGFERSLALRRQAGATIVLPPALTALADVVAKQGDPARARELYLEAIRVAQAIGGARFEKAAREGLAALGPR